MFRKFFYALIVARQASAATQVMNCMSDRQLKDLGYDRSNFVAAQTAIVEAELAAKAEAAQTSAPVNANLVGAL